MTTVWYCQKHGYICDKGEPGEDMRIRNHRVVVRCREILQVEMGFVRFKLLEVPA